MNWEKIFSEFENIRWPERFVVVYVDGNSEILLRGEGVILEWPGDDPIYGIGGFIADIPKKHPANRQQTGRYVWFNQVVRIEDDKGHILWQSITNRCTGPDERSESGS
jgi:hypothetical protein